MPFPELNDNKFEKNLTNGAHSYREKVREQILKTPRSGRSDRKSIDLTITNQSTTYRPSSRRSIDTLSFEQSRLKSASRDRQIIRYNKYIPSQESKNLDSLRIKEDPYSDKEFIGRPNSREFYETPRLDARSARRLLSSSNEQSQTISRENLENNLTKSINFFDFDLSNSKTEQPPVPKPRQKESILLNKQNMLFGENENLKIKRSTHGPKTSRAITPRFDHSRINSFSLNTKDENDLKDESERKFNDSFRYSWVKMREKTSDNLSLEPNEKSKKNVYKKL